MTSRKTVDNKCCGQLKRQRESKPGHIIRDCVARKRKEQKVQADETTKEEAASGSEN